MKKHLFGKQNTEAEEMQNAANEIDLSSYPEDAKGNKIVPNDLFDESYKSLPDGTRSEDGRMVYNGGILKPLGCNPDRDKEVHRMGANALNAKHAQRQTMAETIDLILRQKVSPEIAKSLGIDENSTNQEAGIVAMMKAMATGDTKAANFLRDTVGEKPVDRKEIDANVMTDADKKLLEKVSKRLESEQE